jgi:hypothetical protein
MIGLGSYRLAEHLESWSTEKFSNHEDFAFGGRYNVGGKESGFLYASNEWEM